MRELLTRDELRAALDVQTTRLTLRLGLMIGASFVLGLMLVKLI